MNSAASSPCANDPSRREPPHLRGQRGRPFEPKSEALAGSFVERFGNRRLFLECSPCIPPSDHSRGTVPESSAGGYRVRSRFFVARSVVRDHSASGSEPSANFSRFDTASGYRWKSHLRCTFSSAGDRVWSGTLFVRRGLRPVPGPKVARSFTIAIGATSYAVLMRLAALFATLFLSVASAQSNFSDTWKLNSSLSEMRGLPAPADLFLKIEQTPAALSISAGSQESGPFTTINYPLDGSVDKRKLDGTS